MSLFMKTYQKFGKRHVELLGNWAPSIACYGGAMFCGLIYFTDWKVIATKIPIYNMKFKTDD